jgi:galactokinase
MSEQNVRELFESRFGFEPEIVGFGPGRINLIGEHTDYNDGFVFPGAIDRVTWIAAGKTDGPTELFSEQIGPGESFDAATVSPGGVKGWAMYPAGMAWALREAGKVPNVKAVVTSSVPSSGGVSSSAALEMAFGVVWNRMAELGLSNSQLALLGQRCENKFVGVNSGIMDQMASAMGREGHAMFLDTRSLEIEYAPIPSGVKVVLCDTNKPRALTDSAYNERRSQCEEASRIMGVSKLRDATEVMLEAHRSEMSDVIYRRARHVITEDDRCVAFKQALKDGDLAEVGRLIHASHVSLRDDYEVSCRELDIMAETAGGAPGCIGARMMGAGFGGSCIALVREAELNAFIEDALTSYKSRAGINGDAFFCSISSGAQVVQG